jgi:glutathione S-transferase
MGAWDLATSRAATLLRLGTGRRVKRAAERRPAVLLELYEFEACPFCRRLREALSTLDLSALIHPCPKQGRFRAIVRERGGKEQFPYLSDPNTGVAMYESADIVRYLVDTYGGAPPISLGPFSILSGSLASSVRMRGRVARAARHPDKPLVLYGYEPSPYCRLVRETLCELELEYQQINVARGSREREAFVARSGKMMVPYLVDPNTGREMFESADIVRYLEDTYAVSA